MRIGITCYPTHGGSGVVATELGKHLAENGHEVAFISYSTPHRLNNIPDGVTFHEVQNMEYPLLKEFPYTLALASKMAEVARMKKLQVLHVHYAIPFASAAILARQIVPDLNLKVITTLHGTDVTLVGNDSSFKDVTRLAIEQSDYVTAVSSFLKEQTYSEFRVCKDIEVIHNFIDPKPYCVDSANEHTKEYRGSPFTLMHISNFRAVKRIPDVLKIFKLVSYSVDARLVLVGDGPDCGIASAMASEMGLSDKVFFTGIVDEVSSVLKDADILLLPSEVESFGLVALEAMAAGVPVVASDVGGLPEVISHGESGFLAPLADVNKMAEYVLHILKDGRGYNKFSDAAKRIACDRFHYNSIVAQYEELYRRAIKL